MGFPNCLFVFVVLGMVFGIHSTDLCAAKTVTVRVLVDEEEPRNPRVWQQALTQRVDQASRILSAYSDVKFSVTGFGTWQSDNAITDFPKSLKEFETEIEPEADISIGFSSQYQFERGRTSLGGTHGPLRSHIFIREGSHAIQEAERVEVLVHELSHYLGAAHSGDPNSVMRPILGDGRSRERSFRITLDRQNAKIVRLVSQEVATRRVRGMHQLTVQTKIRLRNEYLTLARDFPRDPVAKRYALLMDQSARRDIALAKQAQARQHEATSSPNPRQSLPLSESGLQR